MSSLIEYLITFVAIISVLLYFYYKNIYRIKTFCSQFPNPPGGLFLGNASDFTSTTAFLESLHRYIRNHGTMVHMKVGLVGHGLLTSDHNFIEFLLTNTKVLKRSPNLRFLEPWIGKGLVTADGGPQWRRHRKLITPAFHFKILEQFVDVFESAGNILVEKLSKKSGNVSLDIYPYISRCTLDVICETAMGTKVDVQNNDISSYLQGVKELCRIFVVRTMSPWYASDAIFRFTKDYEIQEKAVKVLHAYSKRVINTKREELKNNGNIKSNTDVDDLGRKKKKVFLDLILEAKVDGESLSDQEIREEVDTFMFGGHDTTATAISFILYCVAQHKEVQNKILEEQQQLFGSEKFPEVTYANLQEMKYLENVIKESMRLYPPVPMYGRQIDQDLEYNGTIVPKGLGVLIFARGVHMNPDNYPNPEKFYPNRFENTNKDSVFKYVPFGAGSRNCIGQKYAMLEMKSLVSKVVRNFELLPASPKHEMELAPETVLKSLNGVRIGLKLR